MILITGGMGFIGLSTAQRVLDSGEEVLLTYHRTYRAPSWLEPMIGKQACVERVDAANPYDVFRLGSKYKIDGIIHLVVPPINAADAPEQLHLNTMSLVNVLEAARLWQVKRLTLASSVGVYSGVPAGPFKEDLPLRIDSGSTTEAFKKAEETIALFYGQETGLDVVSVRIASIYGVLHNKSWRIPNNVPTYVCQAIRSAVDGVKMDERYVADGGPHEEGMQDLDYVKDTGLALQTLQMVGRLNHRIYNAGRGKLTRVGDIVDAIRHYFPDADLPTRAGAPPRAGKPDGYMDTSRLREDTNFAIEYDSAASVADYIEWMKSNPE